MAEKLNISDIKRQGKPTLYVVFIMGQSNAHGVADTSTKDPTSANDGDIFMRGSAGTPDSNGFDEVTNSATQEYGENLSETIDNIDYTVSVERAIARSLKNDYPTKNICIMKYARNGSSTTRFKEAGNGEKQLWDWWRPWVLKVHNEFVAANYTPKYLYVPLGHAGNYDNETEADDWVTDQQLFITEIQERVGSNNLQHVALGKYRTDHSSAPFITELRASQQALADSNSRYVLYDFESLSTSPMWRDDAPTQTHYSKEAYEDAGLAMYAAMDALDVNLKFIN